VFVMWSLQIFVNVVLTCNIIITLLERIINDGNTSSELIMAGRPGPFAFAASFSLCFY